MMPPYARHKMWQGHFRDKRGEQKPPRERDMADIRRGDKLLAPLDARIASGDLFGLADWLKASSIAGADQTTRTLAMMKVRAAGVSRDELRACADVLC